MTVMEFARRAKGVLEEVPTHLWAETFVELRMAFTRNFWKGPCSTEHGADFFDNVLAGPKAWKEKSEYGDNFRRLFVDVTACGATTEIPSGETVTPCHKPAGHSGDHEGMCLGSVGIWSAGAGTNCDV